MTDTMKLYKLGDFIRIQHGYPFKSEFFADSGDLQTTSLGSFYERGGFKYPNKGKEKFTTEKCPQEYHLKKGDMIIAMTEQVRGLLGATAWIPEDDKWLLNQRCGLLTCYNSNVEVDRVFVYYLLSTKSVREQISRPAQGTKQRNTSPESIYDVKVWLPSLLQQKAIATILDKLDRKIALNNAINAELEKAVKLLYDYWFVQFDFPNAEGKPYRASGGKMVYNEQLKRKIPKGWKAQKLNKTGLCTMMSSGINAFDGEKIYLSTSEVDGIEIVNHSVTTDYANRLQRANMQPRLNSVWFAKMKDTVKNILVNEGAEVLASDYIFSTGFAGLQCTPTSLYYVWNYLRSGYFENKKNLVATGATQQAINDDDLNSFDILVPPAPLIEQFHKTVAPYYHMISKSKFENKELAALRDFLLPLLMNGQVTVAARKN